MMEGVVLMGSVEHCGRPCAPGLRLKIRSDEVPGTDAYASSINSHTARWLIELGLAAPLEAEPPLTKRLRKVLNAHQD